MDRIVSIGAFEHFRLAPYDDFFARCRDILRPGGRVLLHTIVQRDLDVLKARGFRMGAAPFPAVVDLPPQRNRKRTGLRWGRGALADASAAP